MPPNKAWAGWRVTPCVRFSEQISKLIGTPKPTIAAVRDRTHWNSANIKPRHPVGLGLCTLDELDRAAARALNARGRPAEADAGSEESEPAEL